MDKKKPETLYIALPNGRRILANVRRYAASKSLRLHLQANGSILLTAPPWVSLKTLQTHVQGLTPQLESLIKNNAAFTPPELPERIELPLFDLSLTVKYSFAKTSGKTDMTPGYCRIFMREDTLNIARLKSGEAGLLTALQNFFIKRAKIWLPDYVRGIAPPKTHFHLTVRNQRRRMGSCSIHKDAHGKLLETPVIHLNWRSIFLPEQHLRRLCMHEIAHIEYANHSPDFYRHLEKLSPGSKIAEKALNQAWENLPRWVLYHF